MLKKLVTVLITLNLVFLHEDNTDHYHNESDNVDSGQEDNGSNLLPSISNTSSFTSELDLSSQPNVNADNSANMILNDSDLQLNEYQQGNVMQFQQGDDLQYQQGNVMQYQQGDDLQYQQGDDLQYEQGNVMQYQQGDDLQYQQGDLMQYQQGDEMQYQNGSNIQYQQGSLELEGNTQTQLEGEVVSQSQQVYQSQPVITQQLISKPIITQQLISQPIVKRTVVQQPIITKRIIQRKLIQQNQDLPATEENRNINENVTINVPANKVVNNLNVQPMLQTVQQNINLQRQPSQTVTHRPIVNQTQVNTEQNPRVFTAPAQTITSYQTVYPINQVQKENVRLVQQEAQIRNLPTQTLKEILNQGQSEKVYNAQGNEIHIQPVLSTIVQNTNANVELVRQPTQYVNRNAITNAPQVENKLIKQVVQQPGQVTIAQPIIQNVVRNNTTHVVHNPVLNAVQSTRQVPIPTPVLHQVEVVRRVPYKVVLPKPKPIVNNNDIHVKIKRKNQRKVFPVVEEEKVRYRRNYERDVDNNGFYTPGVDSHNNERTNLSEYLSHRNVLASAVKENKQSCCNQGKGNCC
jgi:hypothetical protein